MNSTRLLLASASLLLFLTVSNAADTLPPELRRGLVLYFDFDRQEPGGVVTDQSGSGNHGRVTGAKWTAAGRKGGAYQFDPAGNYISVPNDRSLNQQQITLAAWIKTGLSDGLFRRIFDKQYDNGFALSIAGVYRNDDKYRGRAQWQVNGQTTRSDAVIADGHWHHLVSTFDGSTQKLYVDGKLQDVIARWNGTVADNPYDLIIGSDHAGEGGQSFAGSIDEAMMYNRALSEGEVRLLYAAVGGSNAVAPEQDTPKTLPSSIQVTNVNITRSDGYGEIEHETDFLTNDPFAWCMFRYTGGQRGDKIRVEWRNPLGSVEQQVLTLGDGTPNKLGTFSIRIAGGPGALAPGDWQMRLFVNDRGVSVMPFRISLPPPSVIDITSKTALPLATTRGPYYFQLTAKGGTPPYRWTTVKPFPGGVTLSSTGLISGIPQQTGAFRAIVKVEDSAGNSLSRTFGLGIGGMGPEVRLAAPSLMRSAGQDACSQTTVETEFSPFDANVVLATSLSAPRGNYTVEWLNPRGEVAQSKFLTKSSEGAECVVTALPVAGQRAASDPGNWRVRLLFQINEVFTLKFRIGDKTPVAPVRIGRVALVIDNSAYQKLTRSGPAPSDLDLIANALREDGFEVVRKANVTLADFRELVRSFSVALQAGDTAFVYYSGLAITSNGDDWLLPVNFDPNDPRPIASKAYSVLRLQQLLEDQKAKLKFIVLDVFRQGAGKGLEAARADDSTTMVYATPPGVAPKSAASNSGAFARALAEVLGKPGLNAKDALQNELPKTVARIDASSPPPLVIAGGGADFVFRPDAAPEKRE